MESGLTKYNRSVNDGVANYYTKIDSRLIKSSVLSAPAKAIMMYILSQDNTFSVIKSNIQKQLGFGRKAFNKAWSELVDQGYIVDNGQAKRNGKFSGKKLIINEHPENMSVSKNELDSLPDKASTVSPSNDDTRESFSDNGTGDNTPSVDEKEVGNKNHANQNQINQDQLNEYTNEAEISARLTDKGKEITSVKDDSVDPQVLGIAPIEQLKYMVQNPTSFHEIPAIRSEQIEAGLYSDLEPFFDDDMVRLTMHMYSYLVWKNITFFNYEKANRWKMNLRDYERLYEFCDQGINGFMHAIYLADHIFEKAKESEMKYVSASYLTSQVMK